MRTVFFVSDSTGITAETLGNALMAQFDEIDFASVTIAFVGGITQALEAQQVIEQAAAEGQERPIVFSTLTDAEALDAISNSSALVLDLFSVFLRPLETELQLGSSHAMGRYHGLLDRKGYEVRIDAMDFALAHDDGASVRHYEEADIIMVGVSRSGKTPTCIYLAMQYGLRAANYPLTPDDLDGNGLPEVLKPHRTRLFGLTIETERLQQIRQSRRPDSTYSSMAQCSRELRAASEMYRQFRIPHLDTTNLSIEEIASRIIKDTGMQRRFF